MRRRGSSLRGGKTPAQRQDHSAQFSVPPADNTNRASILWFIQAAAAFLAGAITVAAQSISVSTGATFSENEPISEIRRIVFDFNAKNSVGFIFLFGGLTVLGIVLGLRARARK